MKKPPSDCLHWMVVIEYTEPDLGTDIEFYETEAEAIEAGETADDGEGSVYVARIVRQS